MYSIVFSTGIYLSYVRVHIRSFDSMPRDETLSLLCDKVVDERPCYRKRIFTRSWSHYLSHFILAILTYLCYRWNNDVQSVLWQTVPIIKSSEDEPHFQLKCVNFTAALHPIDQTSCLRPGSRSTFAWNVFIYWLNIAIPIYKYICIKMYRATWIRLYVYHLYSKP